MSIPLISIVVTVFNIEAYLPQCLDSLVTQNFDHYEVIVVDNGSTDRSLAICRKYAELHPHRIRLIEHSLPSIMHRGHKNGIQAARGKYVHIVDGDDYLRPGYLKEAASIIEQENPDVIIGRFTAEVENGAIPIRDVPLNKQKINGEPPDSVISYLRETPAYHLAFWRYIFKLSLLDKDALFNSRFVENSEFPLLDALVTYKILYSARSYSVIEEPFYIYRVRTDSMSAPTDKQKLWHVQSFSEFMMFLCENNFQGEHGAFVRDKMEQEFRLLLSQSDLWGEEQYDLIVFLLNSLKEVAMSCKHIGHFSNALERFLYFLSTAELNHTSISCYFEQERNRLLAYINRNNPDSIFLFPSGKMARNIHRWISAFKKDGIGFLDNNPELHGLTIQGSQCALPNLCIDHLKRQGSVVVIATIYEELDQRLKIQLETLGVKAEQICFCLT